MSKNKSPIRLKVVGHVDLGKMNAKLHPDKCSKQEREERRKQNAKDAVAHNKEVIITDLNKKREELQTQIQAVAHQIANLRKRISDRSDDVNADLEQRRELEQRHEYLTRRAAVREKYLASPITNDQRQRELFFDGIRPQKMDVVHFHVAQTPTSEEVDGVALAYDENHYYIAIDIYPQLDREDGVTTIMDENPDGTFEGIWPKHVVLKKASKFEERFARILIDKYAADFDKVEAFLAASRANEANEIEKLTAQLKEMDARVAEQQEDEGALNETNLRLRELMERLEDVESELRQYDTSNLLKHATSSLPVVMNAPEDSPATEKDGTNEVEESDDDDSEFRYVFDQPDFEPMEGLELDTDVEKAYPHLPYLRGKRRMTTMNWPVIDTDFEPWLRYRLMGNVARLIGKMKKMQALTYVLTEDYMEELTSRAKQAYRGMTVEDVVNDGESVSCAIVFPHQGYEDTILFCIDCRGAMTILMVYIRENRLMFYESYSVQEIIGQPRTDSYLCQSLRETGTDATRLFCWIRNMIVSFLAMERDMERTVNHLIDEGMGGVTESDIDINDQVDTTDDKDVVVRDANWYTDITVNREIPVRGYISHRLCGSGKNKHIKEVWVRPHVKNGYHRQAEVKRP